MLALYPPAMTALRLASYSDSWPEGAQVLPPSESHITLIYLGDTTSLPYQREHLQAVLSDWLAHCDAAVPITGKVNGVGRFNETDSAGMSAVYANFDAKDLPALRQSLVDHLHMASIETPSEHGFTPHITLAYVPEGAPIPEGNWSVLEGITIPSLSLCWGEEHVEFALAGHGSMKELTGDPTTAAASAPSREQSRAIAATPSDDILARVTQQQDEARRLYNRLKKKKELNDKITASIRLSTH